MRTVKKRGTEVLADNFADDREAFEAGDSSRRAASELFSSSEATPGTPNRTISGFHQTAQRIATATPTPPPTSANTSATTSTIAPKLFSFSDELRLSDLELAPHHADFVLPAESVRPEPSPDARPTLAAPPMPDGLDAADVDDGWGDDNSDGSDDDDADGEILAAYERISAAPHANAHLLTNAYDDGAHPADRDDRTVERYIPPSVEDLDYDDDEHQTTDMPDEWVDHLAQSSRRSNRPPPMTAQAPNSSLLAPEQRTATSSTSNADATAKVAALVNVPPPPPQMFAALAAAEADNAMTVPFTPLENGVAGGLSNEHTVALPKLPTPSASMQPHTLVRSEPIPWNPTPPPERWRGEQPNRKRSRMTAYMIVAVGAWFVLFALVLHLLLH